MKSRAILVVVLAAALAACASKGPYPARGPKGEPLDRKHPILYLDQSLPKVLLVTNQRVERREDGRLAVEVTFLNTQPKRVHVQIETTFRTAEGSTTETTNFVDFFLSGNATKTFAIASMNPRADSYLLQVRRMKS